MSIQPYCYIVGWTKQSKFYWGVRTANRWPAHKDFWQRYFTSSEYVTALQYVHGEPDFIQLFPLSSEQRAVDVEQQYLQRCKQHPELWLNRNYKRAPPRLSRKAERNGMWGKPAWNKGRRGHKRPVRTAEWCANLSAARKGRPWSAARRAAHERKQCQS